MQPIEEHDEFLLSQLIDGDLPDDQAAALRARLDRESDLQAAYEAMLRVDRLLAERRGAPPDIDWPRLHARIMDQVAAAEKTPTRLFRLPGAWARLSLPFAAAAVVAWLFWLTALPHDVRQAPHTPPTIQVVHHGPEHGPAPAASTDQLAAQPTDDKTRQDTLVVQYDREGEKTAERSTPIEVTFPHSTQLAQEVHRADQARESLPSWHLFMANTPDQPTPIAPDDFGPPPM